MNVVGWRDATLADLAMCLGPDLLGQREKKRAWLTEPDPEENKIWAPLGEIASERERGRGSERERERGGEGKGEGEGG